MISLQHARLRARLRLIPGVTARPVCPQCQTEVEPRDIRSTGICRECNDRLGLKRHHVGKVPGRQANRDA